MEKWPDKDPEEVLDYPSSWSKLLGDTDELADVVYSLPDTPTGLTIASSSYEATVSTVWLSGGTLGSQYLVDILATTAQGRTFNRTVAIRIRAK